MKKPFDSDLDREDLHRKIIGLGEKSLRKSYYPELQKKLRELKQQIAESKQREDELRRNYNTRIIINDLLRLSLEDIPLDTLLERALEKIVTFDWLVIGASAHIFLFDEETGMLVRRATKGHLACSLVSCLKVALGECLCGVAAQTGEPQFASDIDERHTIRTEGMSPHGHYCLPILIGQKSVGVLCLYLSAGHKYDKNEEVFLTSVTASLAGIIQRDQISAKKEQFERLFFQSQKLESLGTLSGGIAHDFNNLLAPILGYGELALRAVESGSKAEARIHEIVKAAKRAKELVKQILSLSHQDAKPQALTPLQLDKVVEEIFPLVRAAIPTSIEIQCEISPSACQVLADETLLQQILLNLCTNAYHALPETGGEISIRLRQTQLNETDLKVRSIIGLSVGKYQILEVSDNGSGMDTITQHRIFDPYFTTKKQGEGTGLGLAIVNGIAKGFGGMVSVYSELGQGSSFKIYLPCSDQGGQLEGETNEPLPVGDELILVVDDETQIAEMTSETLTLLGYNTVHFTSSSEAIDAFEQDPQRFDLVVTDMTMPKMTGLDLLKRLRGIRSDIPIILCTGFSALINEEKALAKGFQRCLMKPIMMYDLATAVREALDLPPAEQTGI